MATVDGYVTLGGYFGTGDPPVTSNYSPAAGATINRYTPLTFTVETQAVGDDVLLMVTQGNRYIWHVVYDGDSGEFSPLFAARSTVTISGGSVYEFSILPTGGWISSPTVRVFGARIAT